MGALLRPLCWIAGHDWVVLRKNKNVIIRECKFCGKLQTLHLK